MSDRTTTSETPGFADLMVLARLFADPKALQASLDSSAAQATKAREAQQAAERSVVAMRAREAALDRREAALNAERDKISDRSALVEGRHAELRTAAASLRSLETIIKRRLLDHHGALLGLDPDLVQSRLVSLPEWSDLDAMINPPTDAHFAADPAQPTARRVSPTTR